MNMLNKKGIRWWIFKIFGPHSIQNLVNYIDELNDSPELTGEIAIYPSGEFVFKVKTLEEGILESQIFRTAQERDSFQEGFNYGIEIMGGTSLPFSQEDFDTFDAQERSFISKGSKKIH